MEVPDYMQERVGEILTAELQAAEAKNLWAVILELTPKLDGDQYCFLWGDDLQSGVAGFGETPYKAMMDFQQAMGEKVILKERLK